MSDKVSMQPAPATAEVPTTQQQNATASAAIANRFLAEVSGSFSSDASQPFPRGWNDLDMHETLKGIQGDPLQKQTLEQIATDMKDPAMMSKLGLSGSVQRDAGGNITSLSFTSDAAVSQYGKDLLSAESNAYTPTQAEASLKSIADANGYTDTYNGHLTISTSEKTTSGLNSR